MLLNVLQNNQLKVSLEDSEAHPQISITIVVFYVAYSYDDDDDDDKNNNNKNFERYSVNSQLFR
jgi:hypothetical protein